jgi:hypothetical protein
MERDASPPVRGRGGSEIDDMGLDDEEEFSSIEDVGEEPSENPPVDDV